MGFDPNAFTMGLIQSLGQQIGEGQQRVRENQILDELLPQIQQAQDPEEILRGILQLQGTPGIRPETQARFAQQAPQFAALAKQKQQQTLAEAKQEVQNQERSGLINFIKENSDLSEDQLKGLNIKSLNDAASRIISTRGQQEVITFRGNQKQLNEVFDTKSEQNRFLTRTAIQEARQAAKGDIKRLKAAIAEKFPAIKGSDQAVLDAAMVQLLEPFTKIFPGVISREKFKFIADRVASAKQSPETVNAFLDFMEKLTSSADLLPDAASALLQEDPNALQNSNFPIRLRQKAEDLFRQINQETDNFIQQLESGNFEAQQSQPQNFSLQDLLREKARRRSQ